MIPLFYLVKSHSCLLASVYLQDIIDEATVYYNSDETDEGFDEETIWDQYMSKKSIDYAFVGVDGEQYTLTTDKLRMQQILGGQ